MLLLLVGCGERQPVQKPPAQSDPAVLTRDEMRALIDSLANKNPRPDGGGRDKLVYAPKNDYREDQRVRDVIEQLDKYSKSEDLWWCAVEHIDDNRYSLTYLHDGSHIVASIGGLCWEKASYDLDDPFINALGYSDWRVFALRKNAFRDWCNDHKNVPLYQQQIERGEILIKKLDLEINGKVFIGDSERRAQIRRDIEQEIALLEQTKKPIIGFGLILPE